MVSGLHRIRTIFILKKACSIAYNPGLAAVPVFYIVQPVTLAHPIAIGLKNINVPKAPIRKDIYKT